MLWFGLAEAANEKNIHPVFPYCMLFAELLPFYFSSPFLTLRRHFETKTWWQKCWTTNMFIIFDMKQNKEICSRVISLSSLRKKKNTEKNYFKKEYVSNFYLKNFQSVQIIFVLMLFCLWICGVEGLSVHVFRSCHITKSGDQSGMKSWTRNLRQWRS